LQSDLGRVRDFTNTLQVGGLWILETA
jgi:hypothetical protein